MHGVQVWSILPLAFPWSLDVPPENFIKFGALQLFLVQFGTEEAVFGLLKWPYYRGEKSGFSTAAR